tara:strand:- start:47 stop:820 length:774 start_codon:yes stop_codon:yes gene_type:complete
MPRAKSIASIKKDLLRPATTSHFEVEITAPEALRNYLKPKQEKLNLLCSAVELPGSNLATTEINSNFHGVTERHAYRRVFAEETNFTFYVDALNYTPIRFFEQWMEYIANGSLDTSRNPQNLLGNDYSYRMRYPEKYMAENMKVIKFEKDVNQGNMGLNMMEYQFVKSFPRAITSMPLSYDASSLLQCTVAMTYIRYVVNPSVGFKFPPEQVNPSRVNASNILDQSQINSDILNLVGGNDLPLGAADQLRSIGSGFA